MDLVEQFNQYLKNQGGISVCGRVNYRLVWSPEQWEYRHGTFTDYDETGTIFLRTVTETRNAPKYNYLPDCWILEKFFDAFQGEDRRGNGYEPIWVFLGPKGEFLAPTFKVLEALMYYAKNPGRVKNWKERVDEMKKAEEKDVENQMDSLDITTEDIQYKFGERVSLAPSFIKQAKN